MDTDETIAQIVAEGAGKPLLRPARQLGLWLPGTLAYVAMLSFIMGWRDDLAARLSDPFYAAEIATLAGLGISAALASLFLSRPDAMQKPFIRFVPLTFLALWAATAFGRPHENLAAEAVHEILNCDLACALEILLYAFPPATALYLSGRRGAGTRPGWQGFLIVLSTGAIGYLGLRVIEPVDDAAHLIILHVLPVTILCAVGALMGRIWLRWPRKIKTA